MIVIKGDGHYQPPKGMALAIFISFKVSPNFYEFIAKLKKVQHNTLFWLQQVKATVC